MNYSRRHPPLPFQKGERIEVRGFRPLALAMRKLTLPSPFRKEKRNALDHERANPC